MWGDFMVISAQFPSSEWIQQALPGLGAEPLSADLMTLTFPGVLSITGQRADQLFSGLALPLTAGQPPLGWNQGTLVGWFFHCNVIF